MFAVSSAASGRVTALDPKALATFVFEGVTEANACGYGPFEDLGKKKKHPTRKVAICALGVSEL